MKADEIAVGARLWVDWAADPIQVDVLAVSKEKKQVVVLPIDATVRRRAPFIRDFCDVIAPVTEMPKEPKASSWWAWFFGIRANS